MGKKSAKRKKEKQKKGQKVNWQPISMLPTISMIINGMLESAEEQHESISQASEKPHVLDDYTVNRIFKVVGESHEDHWVFEKQLAKWETSELSAEQRGEIMALKPKLARISELNEKILKLADGIKDQTINKILSMDDGELGLNVLLGKIKPPF